MLLTPADALRKRNLKRAVRRRAAALGLPLLLDPFIPMESLKELAAALAQVRRFVPRHSEA